MEIRGKAVLITGASEGIGASCVEAFRKRGARLSLAARSEEKLKRLAAPGDVLTAGDLADPDVRRRCVDGTLERFGAIDILVNNAGVGLYQPSWKADFEAVRRLMEINYFVPLAMSQLVAPHMIARRAGVIVNVGSIAGKVTLPWMTLYSASKYALGALTNGLRLELKQYGVHAMIVCPGYVKTNFQSHSLGGEVPESVRRSKKFAITPERCAEAIVRGVERNQRTVMSPGAGWLFVVAARLLPGLVDWQMHRMYRNGVDS